MRFTNVTPRRITRKHRLQLQSAENRMIFSASFFICLWRSIFGGDSAFVLVEEVETMGISIG